MANGGFLHWSTMHWGMGLMLLPAVKYCHVTLPDPLAWPLAWHQEVDCGWCS